MNDFLLTVGTSLIGERHKLSHWLRSVQESFAEFYVLSKQLYVESRELEWLKDFLVLRVETLKLRMHELLNEKEDLSAIHQSDCSVKEHLIQRLTDLEHQDLARSTELLFLKKRLQEVAGENEEYAKMRERYEGEREEEKTRMDRERKVLREQVGKLTEERKGWERTMTEMKEFFGKVTRM